jgi:hypothetical protein
MRDANVRKYINSWSTPDEPGLEEPWLNPVSMLMAPIGVAGALPKLGASILDPLFSWGSEAAGKAIAPLFDRQKITDLLYPNPLEESYARP